MDAVEIKNNFRCVKLKTEDGLLVDVLSPVISEISKWIQDEPNKPESGGYIVGYEHKGTGNISLEEVSTPFTHDVYNRTFFSIRDPKHNEFLAKARRKGSYYMGAWHTHPQTIPEPSTIDWNDWKETLKVDKTGSKFAFFLIAGIEKWKLWAGDFHTGIISELYECEKDSDGLYLNGGAFG